jgi:nucleoside-diphosphate-sugar epimerase
LRVLVLGAHGFVGSHLVERLEKEGHEATGLGRNQYWVSEVDAVVNCAGQITDVSRMMEDNVTYVSHWLNWMTWFPTRRFIQIGSSSETGPIEGPRSELTPCNPSNLYEATKLAATSLCLGYANQNDMDIVVARPFTLYGARARSSKMLMSLWDAWMNEKPFTCYPGGHDWTYIDDFIDGLMLLLNAPRAATKGRVYHFGTGISTSNAEVVSMFNETVHGGGVKVIHSSTKYHPYDVADWRADSTKAREVLGWSPKVTLREGIHRFVDEAWFNDEKAPGL